MIPVTKPFLPPVAEYNHYVEGIWQRQWLTNNGPLVNELELRLKDYLHLPHLLFLGNGTIALQIAIKALNLTGEIITTPFSYVATTSSIVWEGCSPVFVDIHPETLNIDPLKIEAAITPQTSAILATHVFGNPCDIDMIQAIAGRHNLKIIFDAAHCFGSTYKGKTVFACGDICTTSFHATKLFHTVEGGAVFTSDPALLKKMSYLRNFGHDGPEKFTGIGINGKNSEFHAAMGLVNLNYIDNILGRRKELCLYYHRVLKNLECYTPHLLPEAETNFGYFAIVLPSEEITLKQIKTLTANWISPRRYFYPPLSSLDYVARQPTPVCDDISKRVLCLPLYHTLSFEEIDFIARLLLRVQNN